jgi:hypothetical protein
MTTKPPLPDSASLFRLINRLPLATDISEAIAVLRTELLEILPDVDQIVIGVDIASDLPDPDGYPILSKAVHEFMVHDGAECGVMITTSDRQSLTASTLVDLCRQSGYAREEYHEPDCFEIEYEGGRLLGAIILWRKTSKPPVHRRTLDFIPHLLPFLGYVLSNMITRHGSASPPKSAL